MFRGNARAFATDALARAVADRALARGFDQATELAMRPFFYLPFMHSEALIDQDRCVPLYEALGDGEQLRYAKEHRDVIQRIRAVSASQSCAWPRDDARRAGVSENLTAAVAERVFHIFPSGQW